MLALLWLSLIFSLLFSPLEAAPSPDCLPPGYEENVSLYEGSRNTFERIWGDIERQRKGEGKGMVFPKEIVWLMGAPGAGKGTNTEFIMELRGIRQNPIVISELLDAVPEADEIKARAGTVSDDIVLDLLLRALLLPSSFNGVVVDGFPRTKTQVQFVKYLYDTIHKGQFNQTSAQQLKGKIITKYSMCVLFVDEETSLERQMGRGREAQEKNKEIHASMSHSGGLEVVRPTDLNEDLARIRYQKFEMVLGSLMTLKERFPFAVVNADGDLFDVRLRIQDEFLNQERHNLLQHLPRPYNADVQKVHEQLINRLNSHLKKAEAFQQSVHVIETYIVPSIWRNTFRGETVVQLHESFFGGADNIEIIVDVLAYQGYVTRVTQQKNNNSDPQYHKLQLKETPMWEFQILF